MDRLQNALHSSMVIKQKRTLSAWILKGFFDILRPSRCCYYAADTAAFEVGGLQPIS